MLKNNTSFEELMFERLFNLFQVDYKFLLDIDFMFLYRLKMSPNELNDLEFFRIEYLIDTYNETKKEEHKQKELQEKQREAKEKTESKKSQRKYKMPK